MSSLLEKLRHRGVHAGLNQTQNSFRMAAYIIGPFLVAWLLIKVFLPVGLGDIASMLSFVGWIAYIVLLYAKAKSDAAGFLPFPQSHWFFPDGQQISYDVLIPPKGWELLKEYEDGSCLYRVSFKDKLVYQEEDRPYPDVFDKALWKLPANWNDTFRRNAHGEFFFENLFIDHPACENIEVSVVDWDERGSTRLPVCCITGCSYYVRKVRETDGKALPDPEEKTLTKKDTNEAVIADLKEENRELTNLNNYLTQEHEEYSSHEPENIRQLSDDRISAFLKRHKTVMNASKKSWTRLINFKTFARVFAIAIVVIAVLAMMSHFFTGWP